MKVMERARQTVALALPASLSGHGLLLAALLFAAAFTRFWHLDLPDGFYFDEVYHAFTGREFLRGNIAAWEYRTVPPPGFAYEWTHPPLAKLFMAGGMLFFGENPFGWRFFSALLGTGVVFFVYLLGVKLLRSEVAALAAGFLVTFEGLAFVQSRIAMNDIYVTFFILASLYFMLTDRHLLSGILLGAALASKWSAVWTAFPIAFYFGYRFLQTAPEERRRFLKEMLLTLSYFYVAVPLFVYFLSYLPYFLIGHDYQDWWDLQRQMFWYHSRTVTTATHPYQSPWNVWPIDMRPIFYYLSPSGNAKIYALGNPIVLWFGLPALAFALWQAVRKLRLSFDYKTGETAIAGKLGYVDFALLFVVLAYISYILPWIASPRILFFYHYLPSVPFLALGGGYAVAKLWEGPRARAAAVAWLAAAFMAFVYFYPHLAAVPVPRWLGDSYFWFPTWR